MTSAVPDHTVGLFRVRYDNEALRTKIRTILDHYVSGLEDKNNVLECAFRLRDLTFLFKNPTFQEENEWRISYSPIITAHLEKQDLQIIGMLRELKFRASRYGVLPYFEMPFRENAPGDAIAEVVVGPKNLSAEGLVNMVLLSLGYRGVSVRRSSASYR
jgi:hypothetical protein